MNVDFELLLRILLGTGLGAAIGLERDLHGRPAGVRTHAIVALASATFMVVSTRFVFFQHYTAGDLVGVDASHAWFAVFCPESGWIDFDPTNNLQPSEEHITLAYGRDYGDVSPVAGILTGGGKHTVRVAVDVSDATSASIKDSL